MTVTCFRLSTCAERCRPHSIHMTTPSGISLPTQLPHRPPAAPDRPALPAEESRCTFAELGRWTTAMARKLVAHGARPGDRVGLLLANSPEFVALAHAAPRAGVTLVPLNARLAAPELAWQIADAGARMLL